GCENMDSDLSPQDKKDLDKFIKFFALKFNLAIKDIPEVTHEAKKALAGQLPGIGRSMCVEISLKTSEVGLIGCDKDIKVSYTVYNRLSVLLKSLLAITRVTPAYKLSRKQGHDYCVCTLSPSPSKLSKPLPLDSLQLPLAPGLLYASKLSYQPGPTGGPAEFNTNQVRPPDSPTSHSPLQASLHSQGSDGSGQQDDFVMVDFVSG
ncbi:autophagy protein 13, partial [Goodea atripinnis]